MFGALGLQIVNCTMNKDQKLFSGFFSMVYEDFWFESGTFEVKSRESKFGISVHMFYAQSFEDAIDTAKIMMEGFSDSNHDGNGDFFQMYCQGLIDIEEIFIPSNSSLNNELQEYYGLDVGRIYDLSTYTGKNIKLKETAINEHLRFKA